MINAKDYFEKYLSWQKRESSLRSAASTYETYSSLELQDLRLEAESGNPAALEELGERYLFGLDHLKPDPDQAEALFRQAADQGDPDALNMLAELHMTQQYGKLDYEAYFSYLQQAAEAGCWKAMFNLACAYYKGSEAYEGHGFQVDKKQALHWSTRCAFSTMQLLTFYFSHTCSDNFQDYMQGVYALFVQSVCVSARQLIRGDGVEKNVPMAKSMLTDAQGLYEKCFKMECTDFSALLKYCE
jgi:TPR repeat protein